MGGVWFAFVVGLDRVVSGESTMWADVFVMAFLDPSLFTTRKNQDLSMLPSADFSPIQITHSDQALGFYLFYV